MGKVLLYLYYDRISGSAIYISIWFQTLNLLLEVFCLARSCVPM
jgi:hypothetical protein